MRIDVHKAIEEVQRAKVEGCARIAEEFCRFVVPQILEACGCECRDASEKEPAGYVCGGCRWAADTEAIVAVLVAKMEGR
jgi:hypothetical protein